MKRLKNALLGLLFVFFVGSPVLVATAPAPIVPSAYAANCNPTFLGIPAWYRGLTTGSECTVMSPNQAGGPEAFIVKIALNILQMAMVIVSYIAVFFILYGGFIFMTNGHNPSGVENGRKTVLNATIGLAITLTATTILNFLFTFIGTSADATIRGEAVEVPQVDPNTILTNALNSAYFIAGVISVIVIVVAGMNYVLANGDSSKIGKAKNQILYSIVGLVLIIVAFTITNFITGNFG